MDLAFGRDGTLYALEIDHDGLLGGSGDGALFAVDRRGDKRQILLPAGFLPAPGRASRSATTGSTSRSTRAPRAAGRCCACACAEG